MNQRTDEFPSAPPSNSLAKDAGRVAAPGKRHEFVFTPGMSLVAVPRRFHHLYGEHLAVSERKEQKRLAATALFHKNAPA